MAKYNEEEVADITKRVEAAIEYLKENNLSLSAQISYQNTGEDTFVTKVIPYLQDTKYERKDNPAN